MVPRAPTCHLQFALPLGVAFATITIDQLTKAVVVLALASARSSHVMELAGGVLSVEYVENRGAAFGLFRGQGAVLPLLALAILGGLVVYYRRVEAPSVWLMAAVGLVAGGAVGNLIDRIRLGYVVDFLAVGPWPKFNVADSAITVGVALLGYQVLRGAPSDQGSKPQDPRGTPARRPTLPADG